MLMVDTHPTSSTCTFGKMTHRIWSKKVLQSTDVSPDDVAAAVLIIVYRFRNNLFHGAKWLYEFREQIKNFNHANTALMKAVELHNKADQDGPA